MGGVRLRARDQSVIRPYHHDGWRQGGLTDPQQAIGILGLTTIRHVHK
jgi:hypothetical protein